MRQPKFEIVVTAPKRGPFADPVKLLDALGRRRIIRTGKPPHLAQAALRYIAGLR